MIALFTDFGIAGPYVGQMKMVLHRLAPTASVIDLMHDAPAHDARSAAYLLAAMIDIVPAQAIVVAVVDPGVGGDRPPVLAQADGRYFVGPGNGIFELVLRRAERARCHAIDWRPARLSASFHGRDLFAPIAAKLALGEKPPLGERDPPGARQPDWPDDFARIVYIDRFGNAMTGLREGALQPADTIEIAGSALSHARTFSAVRAGQAFWYVNANGLIEIAVNGESAAARLSLRVGDTVTVHRGATG